MPISIWSLISESLCFILLFVSPATANGEASDSGINSLEEITLGGVKQSVLIRGNSAANPILLFLHGGPGFPEMPFTHIDSPRLEEHFIVVNWDQRGAGMSYSDSMPPESMNIEQFITDTHELIQMLKYRYSKEKIFLIGHSWGSVLGLYIAHRYPENLHAYIGMGQVVNMQDGELISYRFVLEKARKANDLEAIDSLERMGPPPYEGGFQSLALQRSLLAKYGGAMANVSFSDLMGIMSSSPFYTETDKGNFMKAFIRTNSMLWAELEGVDFFEDVTELHVPVYFFAGRCDYVTPFELLERYFDVLKAPHKEIVWFDNSCHWPNLDEPDVYQDKLISIVLKKTLFSK